MTQLDLLDDHENPFISDKVAQEWIASVEGEQGLWRDTILYPKLQEWFSSLKHHDVLLDVGSGQGRLSSELDGYTRYIGIEPSTLLIQRAERFYSAPNRTFILADAREIPLDDAVADAVICVNVLFHISNIEPVLREIARVLKKGGSFFITTVDNDSLELWKSFFINPIIDSEKMEGEMKLPINNLSRNTLYFQPNEAVVKSLERCGLTVTSLEKSFEMNGESVFILIQGIKQ